jgi:hypothetical protein
MARGITIPLVSGGVFTFFWGGIGAATIMVLADAPRELPAWREAFANVLVGLVLSYFPIYLAMLITSVTLKWKKKEVAAYRASLVPFSVPIVFGVLLSVYFLIPGQK